MPGDPWDRGPGSRAQQGLGSLPEGGGAAAGGEGRQFGVSEATAGVHAAEGGLGCSPLLGFPLAAAAVLEETVLDWDAVIDVAAQVECAAAAAVVGLVVVASVLVTAEIAGPLPPGYQAAAVAAAASRGPAHQAAAGHR